MSYQFPKILESEQALSAWESISACCQSFCFADQVKQYITALESEVIKGAISTFLKDELNLSSITVYSKDGCIHCTNLKSKLDQHSVTYENFHIGGNITRDEVIEKYPHARQMPIVVINGEWLPDYHPKINEIVAAISTAE